MTDGPSPLPPATQRILWASILMALPLMGGAALLVRPAEPGDWALPTLALGMAAMSASGVALALEKLVPAARNNPILGWAVCESIAIMGVVATVLGAPLTALGAFLGWSAFLLVLKRPGAGAA